MEPSYPDNSAKTPRSSWIVLALFLFSLAAAVGLGGYYLYNYTFRHVGTVKFSFSSQIPGVELEENKNANAWVGKSLELLGYDKLVEFAVAESSFF
jgi:hypothetical protein